MTGHIEVVKIDYDSSILEIKDIILLFMAIHDPTQIDGQANDIETPIFKLYFLFR